MSIKTSRLILLIITTYFLLIPRSMAEQPVTATTNQADVKNFISLFTYEVRNRTFALAIVEKQLAATQGQQAEAFWLNYLKLEQLNQQQYKPFADKYNISQERDFSITAKTVATRVLLACLEGFTLKLFSEQTMQYIKQLQKLEDLSAPEDKNFFRYVVQQEQAQADALVLLSNGQTVQATQVLAQFVENYY